MKCKLGVIRNVAVEPIVKMNFPYGDRYPFNLIVEEIDLPDGAIPVGLVNDFDDKWPDGSPMSGRWFLSLVYIVRKKKDE